MATKIKRKILNFGEFKKGKNTLETAEKHPIKEGIIPDDAEETQEVESSPEDDLKSNFRSWEADHDNEDDANGLFAILMSRHPKEKEDKLRKLAFDWVGYEEKSEGLDEAKKEKAEKEASIFKRNILDFKKFKDGKDSVQKEKLKPVKESDLEDLLAAGKYSEYLKIVMEELNVNPEDYIGEMTKDAQEYISKKIKKLVGEGRPHDQAVAMAYSYAKKEGYEVPEKK